MHSGRSTELRTAFLTELGVGGTQHSSIWGTRNTKKANKRADACAISSPRVVAQQPEASGKELKKMSKELRHWKKNLKDDGKDTSFRMRDTLMDGYSVGQMSRAPDEENSGPAARESVTEGEPNPRHPKLKGSIGEGSNHSNFSHQSSVKIL